MANISTVASADTVIRKVASTHAPLTLLKVFAYNTAGSKSLTVYDADSTTISAQKQIGFLGLVTANVVYELDYGEGIPCTVGIELEIADATTFAWVIYK